MERRESIKGFILFDTKFDYLTQQTYGFIYELYVFEEYRGMHIAKKLMNFIQKYAEDQGLQTLKLNVFSSNTVQRFYTALGYQVEQMTMGLSLE